MIRRILTYVLAGLALWAAKSTLKTYFTSAPQEALHGSTYPASRH